MKRIAIIAAAALSLAGPLSTAAYADSRGHSNNGRGHVERHDQRQEHHNWRRGERLSSYQREHYRQVDWRRDHLREPPRGYHYVRDDRGETLLVAAATGVILGVILGSQ